MLSINALSPHHRARDVATLFPRAAPTFRRVEDSAHTSRLYVVLVAKSDAMGLGGDVPFGASRKQTTTTGALSAAISRRVCDKLRSEVRVGAVVDAHLQDQLIVFQTLSRCRSSFPRPDSDKGADGASAFVVHSLKQVVDGLAADLGQPSPIRTTAGPFGH